MFGLFRDDPYAPVVKKEDFHCAIAYLVRRLDENTQEENFLHDPTGLHGESNHFRYRPLPRILLRADGMEDAAVAQCLLAANTCEVAMDVSVSRDHPELTSMGASQVIESEDELIVRLAVLRSQRDVSEEHAGRIGILAGDDHHRADFAGETKVGLPDFTWFRRHRLRP